MNVAAVAFSFLLQIPGVVSVRDVLARPTLSSKPIIPTVVVLSAISPSIRALVHDPRSHARHKTFVPTHGRFNGTSWLHLAPMQDTQSFEVIAHCLMSHCLLTLLVSTNVCLIRTISEKNPVQVVMNQVYCYTTFLQVTDAINKRPSYSSASAVAREYPFAH